MKNLINIIQEKLVINKDSKLQNRDLSFDEFINFIHCEFLDIYGKSKAISESSLVSLFINNFNKDAKKFKYRFISEEQRNHWRFKMPFKYCDRLLKDPDPADYEKIDNIEQLVKSPDINVYVHTNFNLGGGDDEYYIFYVNIGNQTYEIYEVIQ